MGIIYSGDGGGVPRKTAHIFAKNASVDDVTIFGSTLAGDTQKSTDLDDIQSEAYEIGWRDAVISNKNYPLLSDMNGVMLTFSQQIAYLLQHGSCGWDNSTTYYAYDLVNVDGIIYVCTIDENIGNTPSSLQGWAVFYDPDTMANVDLSNLSEIGEAKLGRLPQFCVNSGSVDADGNGNCLQLPSGSSTIITKNFIQPILTANGTLGGDYFAVATSNAPSSSYDIWKAFDGDNSTYWITDSSGLNSTITIYNPIALNITQLTYMLSPGHLHYNAPEEGIISGSNDGTTWTQVDTYSIPYNTNVVKTIDLSSNTGYYKYYKWQITDSASGGTEQQTHWYHYISMFYIDIVATYQEEIVSADNIILKGSEVPVKMTNGYNTSYTLTQDNSLDMSTGYADGTYNVYASITDGSLSAYKSNLYIQKETPSNNIITNDVWLNSSVRPLSAYKYNGSNWEQFTGVPVGTATVSSGAVIACETRPYNRTEKLLVSDMPSNKTITLTLGASESIYTAPADGWFCCRVIAIAGSNSYCFIYRCNNNETHSTADFENGDSDTSSNMLSVIFPVKKGDKVGLIYANVSTSTTGYNLGLFFTYAEGDL